MALVFPTTVGGGGGGTVTSVTAADTSIVIGGTAAAPTVRTGTLDVIAADHAPAADWSNNSHKITALANGSAASDAAAFGQIPTALPPNGAAGGDLTGNYPNPTLGNVALLTTKGDILWESANGTAARLAVGTQGQVLAVGASSALSWVTPPGFEINYTQRTTNVNITDTSESTATALISPGAVTFDGAAVLVHVFALVQSPYAASAQDFVALTLFEGATEVTRLGTIAITDLTSAQPIQIPMSGFYRFTPTAGSHTYKICAFTNSTTGTPVMLAGSGGTGSAPPAFVRFTKV